MLVQPSPRLNIDIVIISRLGVGDGGRETWLYNFMAELGRQRSDVVLRIFSLPLAQHNIFTATDICERLDVESIEIPCSKKRIPLALSFVLNFNKVYRQYRHAWPHGRVAVVGVGGLEESLAIFFGVHAKVDNLKKIMWLRTIYTREKFGAIPRILMPWVKLMEKILLRKGFETIIANGDDTAAYYRTHGVSCEVIHNAVNLEEYYDAWRKPEGKLAVAFVGRLADVKGISEFLSIVALAQNSGLMDKVEFHVAGEGLRLKDVQLLHEQGLLKYHGVISNREMPSFLEKIDCCVALTSFTESLGGGGVSNALIEQMAAKKIIIAWDNVIFRAALYPDECYFVSQGDASALHECFCHIVSHSEEAQNKALASREGVKRYDIRNHVSRFVEVLNV